MSGAGRRDAGKGDYQPLAAPFWPGRTGGFFDLLKPSYSGNPPLDALNERAPAPSPDRDLLLWRDP